MYLPYYFVKTKIFIENKIFRNKILNIGNYMKLIALLVEQI